MIQADHGCYKAIPSRKNDHKMFVSSLVNFNQKFYPKLKLGSIADKTKTIKKGFNRIRAIAFIFNFILNFRYLQFFSMLLPLYCTFVRRNRKAFLAYSSALGLGQSYLRRLFVKGLQHWPSCQSYNTFFAVIYATINIFPYD